MIGSGRVGPRKFAKFGRVEIPEICKVQVPESEVELSRKIVIFIYLNLIETTWTVSYRLFNDNKCDISE